MKILHVTASYKPAFIYGGPIYSVAALCEVLVKCKVRSQGSEASYSLISDVEVITTLANGKEELDYSSGEPKTVEGVVVRYFKRISKDHSHFSPSLLWYLWKNARTFDIIHIHSWWNLVSIGSVMICIIKGIKPILSPRGMLGDYTFTKFKSFFHATLGKHLLRKCYFHATTLMEANEISDKLTNKKFTAQVLDLMDENLDFSILITSKVSKHYTLEIFIIHNLVKLPPEIKVKNKVFDGTLNLIFLSRIHPKKGIELLLEALSEISLPFKLTVVGEGDETYLQTLKLSSKNFKIDNFIEWKGAIYGEEKYQLLINHDLFILPSYNENFANVIIESIAVGTPVLISQHVGLKDWVIQNNLGMVFNEKRELITLINKFYSNPFLVNKKQNLNSLIEKYKRLYNLV